MSERSILVLYASEKGNAEAISKRIFLDSQTKGYTGSWKCMSEFNKTPLPTGIPIIIVASSTGEGQPPSKAETFWRSLRRKTEADSFKGISYCILGLGDTNYSTYQAFPKNLIKKFSLGASSFYPPGFADDATGLEDVVEPWIEKLWPALEEVLEEAPKDETPKETSKVSEEAPKETPKDEAPKETPANSTGSPTEIGKTSIVATGEKTSSGKPKVKYVRKVAPSADRDRGIIPLPQRISKIALLDSSTQSKHGETKDPKLKGHVTQAYYLTQPTALKQVIHVELLIDGGHPDFKAGDAFGLKPPNPSSLVEGILKRLNLDGDRLFTLESISEQNTALLPSHIPYPCTIKEALTYYCDLTSIPRRTLLRVLAEFTTVESEKEELFKLCARQDQALYDKTILPAEPSLLDLLNRYSSSNPPLEFLFEQLVHLPTRWYSISNSPKVINKDEKPSTLVSIAFTVVEVEITVEPYQRLFKGICSNWLKDLLKIDHGKTFQEANRDAEISLDIYTRQFTTFRLPEVSTVPVIMIGPGTGVAPFRGFCEERKELKLAGKELGPAWLFYGCRNDSDFLYERELVGFKESGFLGHLEVAYSRKTDVPVYVQHRIKEFGKELWDLMNGGEGICFVCGDGKSMVHDVQAVWIEIIQENSSCSKEDAHTVWKKWVDTGRYKLDVWAAI